MEAEAEGRCCELDGALVEAEAAGTDERRARFGFVGALALSSADAAPASDLRWRSAASASDELDAPDEAEEERSIAGSSNSPAPTCSDDSYIMQNAVSPRSLHA